MNKLFITDDTIGLLNSIHAHGMDPIELANWLKEGIENDPVLVVPYKESKEMLGRELQNILDYSSPEGMQRYEESKKKQDEDMAKMMPEGGMKDVGFAKAKKDIDWVDSDKKAN